MLNVHVRDIRVEDVEVETGRLGTGGRLSVFTQIPAHLLADVSGYLLS